MWILTEAVQVCFAPVCYCNVSRGNSPLTQWHDTTLGI
uniref:Uncharacterized protein n=1 Tax=Anguilla anguilla TaxID=7936 RepID=A0A0E9TSV8_ANGAN